MPNDIYDSLDVARITIQSYRGALIASIQVDLEERVLLQFQSDLLSCIGSSEVKFVIIDLSGVDVLDEQDFGRIRRIIGMVSLMGTDTTLCGIQPGVAAALVDLDEPLEGLRISLNLDTALADFEAATSSDQADESPQEMEDRDKEAMDESVGDEARDSQ